MQLYFCWCLLIIKETVCGPFLQGLVCRLNDAQAWERADVAILQNKIPGTVLKIKYIIVNYFGPGVGVFFVYIVDYVCARVRIQSITV